MSTLPQFEKLTQSAFWAKPSQSDVNAIVRGLLDQCGALSPHGSPFLKFLLSMARIGIS